MIRMIHTAAALLLMLIPAAVADEYWVSYQGNDYPENEGWTRQFSDENGVFGRGGAIRSLEDGTLVLDSLRSVMIVDYYETTRPIDPDPGELFIMRWRFKIDSVPRLYDPTIGVFSDRSRGVGFEFSESSFRSAFETNVRVSFEPHEFHVFELRSSDMEHYDLLMDGSPVLVGRFMPAGPPSHLVWGDGVQGATSLSRWDYVEFGVVPEPSSMLCVLFALPFLGRTRSSTLSRSQP
jgi:hypothetical protein